MDGTQSREGYKAPQFHNDEVRGKNFLIEAKNIIQKHPLTHIKTLSKRLHLKSSCKEAKLKKLSSSQNTHQREEIKLLSLAAET